MLASFLFLGLAILASRIQAVEHEDDVMLLADSGMMDSCDMQGLDSMAQDYGMQEPHRFHHEQSRPQMPRVPYLMRTDTLVLEKPPVTETVTRIAERTKLYVPPPQCITEHVIEPKTVMEQLLKTKILVQPAIHCTETNSILHTDTLSLCYTETLTLPPCTIREEIIKTKLILAPTPSPSLATELLCSTVSLTLTEESIKTKVLVKPPCHVTERVIVTETVTLPPRRVVRERIRTKVLRMPPPPASTISVPVPFILTPTPLEATAEPTRTVLHTENITSSIKNDSSPNSEDCKCEEPSSITNRVEAPSCKQIVEQQHRMPSTQPPTCLNVVNQRRLLDPRMMMRRRPARASCPMRPMPGIYSNGSQMMVPRPML